MSKHTLLVASLWIILAPIQAQIAPPSLGKVNSASWVALGLREKLNESGTLSSTSFFGYGRSSQPDTWNPYVRSSIYVFNQEVALRIKKHWQFSSALSYRWQNRYKSVAPFERDDPRARQELRAYARVTFLYPTRIGDYALSYRPELRWFDNPDFSRPNETFQFRSRFAAKATFNLNESKSHKMIATTEFFYATSRSGIWDKWQYKESRLSVYFSSAVPRYRAIINIGYMSNLIGKPISKYAHYVGVDLTFRDIF